MALREKTATTSLQGMRVIRLCNHQSMRIALRGFFILRLCCSCSGQRSPSCAVHAAAHCLPAVKTPIPYSLVSPIVVTVQSACFPPSAVGCGASCAAQQQRISHGKCSGCPSSAHCDHRRAVLWQDKRPSSAGQGPALQRMGGMATLARSARSACAHARRAPAGVPCAGDPHHSAVRRSKVPWTRCWRETHAI